MFKFNYVVLCISLLALGACQKKTEISLEARANEPHVAAYSKRIGADSKAVIRFADSLWNVHTPDTGKAECLEIFDVVVENSLHVDNSVMRTEFLNCLSKRGLSAFNEAFLLKLIPLRIERIRHVHQSEMKQTLALLNWIFDLSLEQFHLRNDGGYWFYKDESGQWTSSKKKDPSKTLDSKNTYFTNHADFGREANDENDIRKKYIEGDINLQISNQALSALIPQFTMPERRLTHMSIYKGQKGALAPHFVEAVFEEGVRPKYLDLYRVKDEPFESYVYRYNDKSRSPEENIRIRKEAAEYSESQIGAGYSFTVNEEQKSLEPEVKKNKYFCTHLNAVSYAHSVLNSFSISPVSITFDDARALFPFGFSTLRTGLSRNFAEGFGVKQESTSFPSAGDFVTIHTFEPIALFVRPDLSKDFSDRFALSEVFVDELDKGADIKIPDDVLKQFDTYIVQRPLIREIMGKVRQVHRHSLFRDVIVKSGSSLEQVGKMKVKEFKDMLNHLDKERALVQSAAGAFLKKKGIDEALRTWGGHRPDWFGGAEKVQSKFWSDDSIEYFKTLAEAPAVNAEKETPAEAAVPQPRTLEEITKTSEEVLNKLKTLSTYIDRLTYEEIKEMVDDAVRAIKIKASKSSGRTLSGREHFRNRPTLPVIEGVIEAIEKNKAQLTPDELVQLTSDLKTYATFLMIVPSLIKEINKHNPEGLQRVIEGMPFFASEIKDGTLKTFSVYDKTTKGLLEKYNTEFRDKLGLKNLWQTPPWTQRMVFEKMIPMAPTVVYKN